MESFTKISDNQNFCLNLHRAEEDQELNSCLAEIDIRPSDSRDSFGRDRFHQFHPIERTYNYLNKFLRKFGFYRYIHVS